MTGLDRASLYWQTARHLRPSQIAYQLLRRAFPLPGQHTVSDIRVRGGLKPQPFARPVVPVIGPQEIAFLNRARPLDVADVDWAAADFPKLWRYNLHYFDYLQWPVYGAAAKARLIDSWIVAHPVPAGDGWEPYPLSLRVVNWIRYWLSGKRVGPVPPQWLASLATQLAGLESRVEYHLLANHLVKNGKALLFGGMFFEGAAADRWRELGLHILTRQADEQILPDGGHFERSPMYHCIVLEDYLDALNMVRSGPRLVPAAVEEQLVEAAIRALAFLADTRAGDGRIPLFNDAAFRIAVEPSDLLDYGARVLAQGKISGVPARLAGSERVCFPDTGYFGYREGGDSLLIDCGPVGPDYQPGHAHCDTLSYELCVDGQRVIVDTGVFGYEPDDLRTYARRTASHNTVEVDGAEQSEIWGAFRVGRRAHPLQPSLGHWEQGRLEFQGAHDGYRRLKGSPVHHRRIRMQRGGPWDVFDLITGSGGHHHRAVSYVHLAGDMDAVQEDPATFRLAHRVSGLSLRLRVTGGSLARLTSGYHFPEFGLRRDNKIISIEREGNLPLEMHYRIERS
ncbi:MAG: alginate lyase family protein [Gammaproteobacteria bacterium]